MPEDFENYKCKENKVKLCVFLHNVEKGEFTGLQKWLAYIMVRGDKGEMFLSYGFDEDKSNVLYSSYEQNHQSFSKEHCLGNITQCY